MVRTPAPRADVVCEGSVGEAEYKPCPADVAAVQRQRALLALKQARTDRQPQAVSFWTSGEVGLKDPGREGLWDAWPIVGDAEGGGGLAWLDGKPEVSGPSLRSVSDEVAEDRLQQDGHCDHSMVGTLDEAAECALSLNGLVDELVQRDVHALGFASVEVFQHEHDACHGCSRIL